MALRLSDLAKHFGWRSSVARQIIPQLVAAIQPANDATEHPALHKLALRYDIPLPDRPRLLAALQSYYAAVLLAISAFRCGEPSDWQSIASGEFFRQHNLLNLIDERIPLPDVEYSPLLEHARKLNFQAIPHDPLRLLYQRLFPAALRHHSGEYYTPDWLTGHVLQRAGYDGSQSLLDPACGSGGFLRHAVQQSGVDWATLCERIAGMDRSPLACLSARANLLLLLGKPDTPLEIPVYCADSVLETPLSRQFDIIVGNPPWINWETLEPAYREQTRSLWREYGLFAHRGMDIILGKGKKDLSALMTVIWADRYLREGGIMSLILTETTLKSSAAAGFRKLQFGALQLRLLHVDDLSKLRIFKGASTRSVVLTLQKGATTTYPVAYSIWRNHSRLRDQDSLQKASAKITRHDLLAEPIGGRGSPLATASRGALDALHRFRGQAHYQAHAGVYTGGANAVYWLQVLEDDGKLARVRNLTAGAKRPVPQREAFIESDLIFPLLRSGEVTRWHSAPGAAILMVQDVETRQGYDPDWLREHYPYTYDWLLSFEDMLRKRAAFRRYFGEHAPFYSMFDVGSYSFAPYKVIWQGMGANSMAAAVQQPVAGKPVMSNQAVQPFIATQSSDEAHYLAACLNNPLFGFAVLCHSQAGGKSFAQPGTLQHLYIPRYEATNPQHQRMVALSQQAHAGQIDDEALLQAAAEIWGLNDQEVADVLDSLAILR